MAKRFLLFAKDPGQIIRYINQISLHMSEKHILVADADAQTVEEFRHALGQQWTIKSVATGAAA